MSEMSQDKLALRLRALTPARVGLGRTGVSQRTRDLLDFQLAHARARDAVHARLETGALAGEIAQLTGGPVLRLRSAAPDRATYLQRPDLGRRLDEASRSALECAHVPVPCDLALVLADGLSALAVERHAVGFLAALRPHLAGWRLAPVILAEQARVALGDEIGALLHATLVLVAIGERPGLSSPDSLGVYITWEPTPGRNDAERNCISNIHAAGLTYADAAAQAAYLLTEARRRQLTGVALKQQSNLSLEG